MKTDAPISGNELVVKDNGFMQSAYNLDIVELRLIALAIIMLRRNCAELPEVATPEELKEQVKKEFEKSAITPLTIHSSLYADLFGTTRKNAYQVMQDGAERLSERKIKFSDAYVDKTSDKVYERLNNLRWTTMCSYIHGVSAIQICFSPQLIPFLIYLDSNFTGYEIRNLVKLKTIYEFYMYELGVSWRNVGSCVIDRMALRHKLGIFDDTLLPRLANFNRMLTNTLKTINDNTDLNMQLDPIYTKTAKGGKSIEQYKLTVGVKTLEERQRFGLDINFEKAYKSTGAKKTIRTVNPEAPKKPKASSAKDQAVQAKTPAPQKRTGAKGVIFASPDENGNWDFDLIVNNFHSPLFKITGMDYKSIPDGLIERLMKDEPVIANKTAPMPPEIAQSHVKLLLSQKMTVNPSKPVNTVKQASHNIDTLTAEKRQEIVNNSAFRSKYAPIGESNFNVINQKLDEMLKGDLNKIPDLAQYL